MNRLVLVHMVQFAQDGNLLYPRNNKNSFENAQKMSVLDTYFQNFLQKVIFMQSLGLYYSGKNTPKGGKIIP